MAYARISATLPEEVLVAADRLAAELDRPRSWVIAEALRAWDGSAARRVVREVAPAYEVRAGLGEQREAQLRADLALTPEQRVIEAERTARAAPPGPRWTGILTFERFEDYLSWKRSKVAGP